jgi:hypothetical protein
MIFNVSFRFFYLISGSAPPINRNFRTGAGERNRTAVSSLARMYNSRYTTPAGFY